MKYRTFATVDGAEETVDVEFDFTPGAPAKTYGPPEDCYPADPFDLEITAVFNEAMDEISDRITADEMDRLNERIYDDADRWWPEPEEREADQYEC